MSIAIAAIRRNTAQLSLHRLSAALQLSLICAATGHVLMNRELAERLAAFAISH
ncbi:hypothetical protein SAMN04488038_105150 [Solimonas aquatica]|uniref:Uncharacterized protein n=1 Tax=Solimonas aquatica TaxID=489703 RepID=A0A1H9ETU6_9GAMM|nr:hypothetical protein [Solimonas aquatica]SEQ29042.1 hypothetical protein SAMN04488038_105150 [Solimonas aquatica]